MLRECNQLWNSFWAPLKYFRKVHRIQIIFRAARKNIYEILVSPQMFCHYVYI
jgi:hypothetical protein